jgi:hypothetical protein
VTYRAVHRRRDLDRMRGASLSVVVPFTSTAGELSPTAAQNGCRRPCLDDADGLERCAGDANADADSYADPVPHTGANVPSFQICAGQGRISSRQR